MNKNVNILLNLIISFITESESVFTEELIREKALFFRTLMNPTNPVSDEEHELIVKNLLAMLPVKMEEGACIQDRRENYTPWYKNRLANIKSQYWWRYCKYLHCDKKWSHNVINTIDLVTNNIVGLLGDPQQEAPFSRKGLVLGDVQSGKTANFTAICNKAVDAGYRIIILLSGLTESLRKQTQMRMDLEFAGSNSNNQFKQIRNEKNPGVSKYNQAQVVSFTTCQSDFDAQALDRNNMSLLAVKTNIPIFFVIKKNVSILKNLFNWLSKSQNLGPDGEHIDMPVLIIDDEADNASINVNDTDSDPTRTNEKIRLLLKLFSRVSYLAVTATPFANIFINPENESEMLDEDLFPRDFIYALSPPTSNQELRENAAYIGANHIFGDKPITGILENIDDLDCILPNKHKKDFEFSQLPESLKEAIVYFCLANVIRDIRGDTTTHRSMLIHISHLTAIHRKIEGIVNMYILEIQNAIMNYANLPESEAMQCSMLQYLKRIWNKYNFQSKANISWTTILAKYLYPSIVPITVKVINSSGGILDYEGNKEYGLRVIAIGGNCLSRGLTLDGLMVSYFRRNTQMYDTLLQMGRWFGFRPGYADLCKIWMPYEIQEWFEQITESYIELKDEIYVMQEQGLTPKDFGLKVRKHPGSLLPTARNKMRSGAQVMKRPITISGRLLETPRLLVNSISKNEETIKSFVKKLDSIGERDLLQKNFFWHNVSSEEISNLLNNFPTDPWNLMFRGYDIAKYIDKHPCSWDVVIMEGEGQKFIFTMDNGSIEINSEKRKVEEDDIHNILKIMGSKLRVAAGGASKVGLSFEQINRVKAMYEKARELNPELGVNIPDDWYFRIERPPLLMIHVIERSDKPGNFLFAIGTGFPGGKDKEELVEYVVNLVEWKNHYMALDDSNESEE